MRKTTDKFNTIEPNGELEKNLERLKLSFIKENYQNFTMSGSVFNMLISLGVEGSFDKAIDAYKQASLLNPLNPSLKYY